MLDFTVSVQKTDKTTEEGKYLVIQKDGGNFFAVFADVCLKNGTIHGTEGIVCAFKDLPKGRFVGDYMKTTYWGSPFFGENYGDVPDRTQALLISYEKGYLCILPLVGKCYKTVLKGSENTLLAVAYTGVDTLSECNDPLFVYGYGDNPYELLKETYRYAIKTMGRKIALREERAYPSELDYLGWCSWDAMHIHVSKNGILEKCRELKAKNVPVKWVLIDDMWADVPHLNEISEELDFWDMIKEMYQSKMRSFTADPIRFPNGLKACVDEVKKMGIETAIWFPTSGYWAGFLEDGELVKNNPEDVTLLSNGQIVIRPQRESFDKFYSLFADYIIESGASFIKIDRQSFSSAYAGVRPIGEIASALQGAIENVANSRFDGAIINCMGMASENAYNREKTAILRCSDDFLPNDGEWFKRHINDCAYNSLFWGNLYYTDWDMFWTNDGQAKKNAVLHALSGGPVYISDKIGATVPEVLNPLCETDGKIIRADETLVPVAELLFTDASEEKTPMAVFNRKNGAVVLAAFNIYGDESVEREISLSQFKFTSEQICVYDWFTKTAKIFDANDKLRLKVENTNEIKLLVLSEVKDGFAIVGDDKKYLSPYNASRSDGNTVLVNGGRCLLVSEKDLIVLGALRVEKHGNIFVCETDGKTQLKVDLKK